MASNKIMIKCEIGPNRFYVYEPIRIQSDGNYHCRVVHNMNNFNWEYCNLNPKIIKTVMKKGRWKKGNSPTHKLITQEELQWLNIK